MTSGVEQIVCSSKRPRLLVVVGRRDPVGEGDSGLEHQNQKNVGNPSASNSNVMTTYICNPKTDPEETRTILEP